VVVLQGLKVGLPLFNHRGDSELYSALNAITTYLRRWYICPYDFSFLEIPRYSQVARTTEW
jgi:hypothetical protein